MPTRSDASTATGHTPPTRVPPPPDQFAIARRQASYVWIAAQIGKGATACDLGCGDGLGAAVMASMGVHTTGVDASTFAIARAARDMGGPAAKFRTADPTETGLSRSSVDAVVVSDALTDADDPLAVLGEAHRLAVRRVFVVTPNRLTTSPGRTRPLDGRRAWEYTPDELTRLLVRRFPEVDVLGLHLGRRLRAIERVVGRPLPAALDRLAPADRAWWLSRALAGVDGRHLHVSTSHLRDAVDLIGVAACA